MVRRYGLAGTSAFFDSIGYRPGRRLVYLAGLAELTGGLPLAHGLLSPLVAAIITPHDDRCGRRAHASRPVGAQRRIRDALYSVTALGVAITRRGGVSLDRLFTVDRLWRYGLYSAALGLLACLPFVMMCRQRLTKKPDQQQRTDTHIRSSAK